MNRSRDEDIFIYKILTSSEWEEFQVTGSFKGSPADQRDGFIHASFEDQYPVTIEKFFKNITPLILLKISIESIDPNSLIIEANKPNGHMYPHIYGNINLSSIHSSKTLLSDEIDTQDY